MLRSRIVHRRPSPGSRASSSCQPRSPRRFIPHSFVITPLSRTATAPVSDPLAQLNERLQRGEVTLEQNGPSGYLTSVLSALGCADGLAGAGLLQDQLPGVEDQSDEPARDLLQRHGRRSGWVRGGPVLEFVAQDPKQGSIFYTLEQSQSGVPQFERNDTCVMCHVSEATQNVPGMFVGSVFPSVNGTTMYGPAYTTDHRSPFELRWGGWFVTGTHQRDPAHGERDRHRSVRPGGDGDAGDRSRHEAWTDAST